MTQERLNSILSKIAGKYAGYNSTPTLVHKIYEELSAVIRGLHKTEHFLNVAVDINKKIVLCKDEETLNYISLVPYLDNRLMGDCSVYLIYLLEDSNYVSFQCAMEFKDLYDHTDNSRLGFDVEIHQSVPLASTIQKLTDLKDGRNKDELS